MYRRFCLTLALSTAFAGGAGSPLATAQIFNGGFEAPSSEVPQLDEWQYAAGATRDASLPHGGSFVAKLENLLDTTNVNVRQQTSPGSIVPAAEYQLSYWAQGEYGVSGVGQAQIAFLNAGGAILPGWPQFFNIPASTGFVQAIRQLTAPADASAVFLAFNAVTGAVSGATAVLYVDDVSLSLVGGSFGRADFNQDTLVNGDDLTTWIGAFGATTAADANEDGASDGADVLIWQQDLTLPAATATVAAVPEPAGLAVAASLLLAGVLRRQG